MGCLRRRAHTPRHDRRIALAGPRVDRPWRGFNQNDPEIRSARDSGRGQEMPMPGGKWVDTAAIDPGGPQDPTVDPQPVSDADRPGVFTLMAPGWYPPEEMITQAYGFCFTTDRQVVLVTS